MREYLFDPERWRVRAAQLREQADRVGFPSRQALLRLAALYDGLAERSEERRKKRDS